MIEYEFPFYLDMTNGIVKIEIEFEFQWKFADWKICCYMAHGGFDMKNA